MRGWACLGVVIGCCVMAHVPSFAGESVCRIDVVDAQSGWPVPLVELRTTSGLRWVSDNAGVVACDAPELMGRETWFYVRGQGYDVPADGFGYRGVRLTPEPGKTLRVEVNRTIVARRVGRLTGSGLFAELARWQSSSGGTTTGDLPNQHHESGVVGCDSVQTVAYGAKQFWLWGDTTLFHYPLGVFHASAATTAGGPLASYRPPLRLPYDYYRDEQGRPRGVAQLPGDGPTWLFGLTTVPDAQQTRQLVACYVKIKPPLTVWQRGLCRWDDQRSEFKTVRVLWDNTHASDDTRTHWPDGHAVHWEDPQGDAWLLFGNPFPTLKMPATFEAWQDTSRWETVEAPQRLQAATGGTVRPHSGHIAWRPFRERWVAVFVESFGKPSSLGEVWYAEADQPLGPWSRAVKVLSHKNYSFYNPCIHPEFTRGKDPYLFFEGTYTVMFADAPQAEGLAPGFVQPTPRYDYNQVLYRIDLDDPQLVSELE